MHPSKGRSVIVFVSLFMSVVMYGQQGKSFRYHLDGKLKSSYVVSPDHNLNINYSINEIDFTGLTNSHGDFFRVSIPGHNRSSLEGSPELPVFSRMIAIPAGEKAIVKIHDVRSRKIFSRETSLKGLLLPRQPDATKNDYQKEGFVMDKKIYSARGLIKSDTVTVEYLGNMRGNQLATLQISPVRYNPYLNVIEVITSMRIEVSFTKSGSATSGVVYSGSPVIDQSLQKGIINYYPDGFITGYSTSPVGLVIISDTLFRKNLKPFITWKTQEGYRVSTIYMGTWAGGNSFTGLKDTLSKIYNSGTKENPSPEYLLIVGDVDHVPLSDGTLQISDLYYGEFDGNGDYLPEMFIGRLPVADTVELKNVMSKLLQYEKFQFADTNTFYKRALVTAGNDGGYDIYMNGQVKYASTYYLNSSNGINATSFYYPKSASAEDSIKKLINKGVSFINYSGHGDITGWVDPVFKVPDVALLQNKNMYPFVITNACQTAHYDLAASLGNKMIVSADKGAIGYIGCSNDSYWDEDFYWSVGVGDPNIDPKYSETGLGAYDRLFHKNGEKPSDWFITMGQVNFAGNLSVSASSSNRKRYYWETYTLLGDPSLIPVISKPDSFNLQIPDILPKGITSLSLISDPFAYFGVSRHDTLYDASYVSPYGSVSLELPGLLSDSCMIVATGQNRIPLIKKIKFGDVNHEFINLTASAVNDSSGNNNGQADFSESFWLSLRIDNLGLIKADSLYAKLTTSSNIVKILSDSLYIGSLNGKTQLFIPRAMSVKVADSVPDKALISMDLILKDKVEQKRYRIDVSIHAPDITILSCYIDDTQNGNGNYLPEPGETVDLIFKVLNSGTSDAAGTFKITCPQTDIAILPPGSKSGTIASGQTATYSMPATISSSASLGEYFTIKSLVSCTPYDKSKDFEFRTGKARENFEVKSFNIFPWINNSPVPWIITTQDAYDGICSAQSGKITHNQNTRLIMKLYSEVADSLRFYCRVSSEQYYDFLTFRVNDNTIFRISGETGWMLKSVELPAGLNKIEWIYSKDEAISAGYDCAWLDLIDFPDPSNLFYIQNDISVDKIKSPLQNTSFLTDSVSVKVSNQGKDPVNGFNLAYSVNNVQMASQHFNDILGAFQDSVTVWFMQKPDLSRYDYYDIKVYAVNNPDDYHLNDTADTRIENIKIVEPFKAYPNPFTDKFRVILNSFISESVSFTLTNSLGIKIKSFETDIQVGENYIDVDCTGLPSGFYFLTVSGPTIKSTNKMIKVR